MSMDTASIRTKLAGYRVEAYSDYALSISQSVIRADVDNVALVAVGSDQPADAQVYGLLDALHYWRERHHATGPLRYVIGSRENPEETQRVLEALAGLQAGLAEPVDLSIEVDFAPTPLPDISLAQRGEHWLPLLHERDTLMRERLPMTALKLGELVDDPSFRWHVSVSAPHLSGRIDGLQVCTLALDGSFGTLAIGADRGKRERTVRAAFREAADDRDAVTFGSDDLLEAAGIIVKLVEARRSGTLRMVKAEHRLETQILREAIPVISADGRPLVPIGPHGQFPAYFSSTGSHRFTDVLLRDGNEPWVIELKDLAAGRGRYLRHGIGQAVLYRRFIREATPLHPWFAEQKPPLDASSIRAAVAFPSLSGAGAERRRSELTGLAAMFGVEVIELDVSVDDTPAEAAALVGVEGVQDSSPDYRVLIRFATEPDDPRAMAEQIRLTLGEHELAIVEDDDIEITLRVVAPGTFEAARIAMDRVQAAISETEHVVPELLNIDVEGIFAWAETHENSQEEPPA